MKKIILLFVYVLSLVVSSNAMKRGRPHEIVEPSPKHECFAGAGFPVSWHSDSDNDSSEMVIEAFDDRSHSDAEQDWSTHTYGPSGEEADDSTDASEYDQEMPQVNNNISSISLLEAVETNNINAVQAIVFNEQCLSLVSTLELEEAVQCATIIDIKKLLVGAFEKRMSALLSNIHIHV